MEGKEDVLRQHCSDELLERLMGLYRHAEAQGTFQDSTLLFINDVEMLDIMFVENQPVIVVTFSCQQINCMRDKFGNVIEGREDEIQQVNKPQIPAKTSISGLLRLGSTTGTTWRVWIGREDVAAQMAIEGNDDSWFSCVVMKRGLR